MTILVTGGAGFLGSHLCARLIEKGEKVICIDNLITGSRKNIEPLLTNPNFSFLNEDVDKPLPHHIEVEQIYHLASPASPNIKSSKSYHALAFETMKVNTEGTWHLCELAIKNGAKLLFCSTSEVYGEPLEHPQKETYRGNVSTIGPRSVYDEAKRFGETIVSAHTRIKNLDARIVRIFNTYGPHMALDDGRVVTEFVKAALKNEPLFVEGEGKTTRSFCYVSDLIDGLILVMEIGERGQVYNLGNPEEHTILELAQKIISLTGSRSIMDFSKPNPEDGPTKRRPDITKAKERLGWNPEVSLDEGLTKVIEYMRPLV